MRGVEDRKPFSLKGKCEMNMTSEKEPKEVNEILQIKNITNSHGMTKKRLQCCRNTW